MALADPHIAILMATFNGARFIEQQLQSIADQTHKNWSLWISDDGSDDGTLDHIKAFAKQVAPNKVVVLRGPQKGPVRNFMGLLNNPKIDADLIALSDQDDIWAPTHLSGGKDQLDAASSQAQLWCGPTVYIDADGDKIGHSPRFELPPSFGNALVQNIAGGNTMMLNRAAHELVQRAGADVDVPVHDWWLYQLVSGAGGLVIYDKDCSVMYRQHRQNVIGSNSGAWSKFARQIGMIRNRFHHLNEKNLAALRACSWLLDQEGQQVLDDFAALRKMRGFRALRQLKRAGVYRQTSGGMQTLRVAAFLGKL